MTHACHPGFCRVGRRCLRCGSVALASVVQACPSDVNADSPTHAPSPTPRRYKVVEAQAYLLERTGGKGVTDALALLLGNLEARLVALAQVASAADQTLEAKNDGDPRASPSSVKEEKKGEPGDGDGEAKGSEAGAQQTSSSSAGRGVALVHTSPEYKKAREALDVRCGGWGGGRQCSAVCGVVRCCMVVYVGVCGCAHAMRRTLSWQRRCRAPRATLPRSHTPPRPT